MVGIATILAVCVTLVISLILPIAICIIYGVKNKGKGVWTAWLLGGAGFFVFQLVIRIPILNVISGLNGFSDFVSNHYVLYFLILAFTAALFEVAGRYIAAKLMRKNLTFERGIAAGLGHGGVESMLLIGMTYVNNLIYIFMINSGVFGDIIQQTADLGVDTDSLLLIQDTLVNSGCGIYLLAGYERILTMIVHTALSLLVCYFVSQKKDVVGIIICLLCHTLVDSIAPFVNGMAGGYLGNGISTVTAYAIIYTILTIFAAAAIVEILVLKKRFPESPSNHI